MTLFRRLSALLTVLLLVVVAGSTAVSAATTAASAPALAAPVGLSMLEIKITGDEYVMIQNNTATAISDLSIYWLNAFNNVSPLAAGVSSSSQQLPTAALQPHQTLLLSASPMQTCGASVAGKLSVSLSDSGGFLQLTRVGLDNNGAVTQTAGDFVSWSGTISGIIPSVPSSTKDPRGAYYRYLNGNSYTWQLADLDATNGCQLNIVVAGGSGSSSAVTPLTLAATSPPATILGTTEADDGTPVASLPAADIGLNAPQLSELLPNPVGTGNDANDEFIELYNPNPQPFDLTGFTLQTGLTTTHSYVFPAGSLLAATSFKAFYASDTKLSLSNTSGQAALLDPFNNVISNSDVYGTAKDGISWALAQGVWRWTTQVTPGAANVIKTPPTSSKKSKTSKTTSKKNPTVGSSHAVHASTSLASSGAAADDSQGSVVHGWVLALIAGLALLYGAYEYRRDITNRLYQLRTKLGSGRKPGKTAAGESSD